MCGTSEQDLLVRGKRIFAQLLWRRTFLQVYSHTDYTTRRSFLICTDIDVYCIGDVYRGMVRGSAVCQSGSGERFWCCMKHGLIQRAIRCRLSLSQLETNKHVFCEFFQLYAVVSLCREGELDLYDKMSWAKMRLNCIAPSQSIARHHHLGTSSLLAPLSDICRPI